MALQPRMRKALPFCPRTADRFPFRPSGREATRKVVRAEWAFRPPKRNVQDESSTTPNQGPTTGSRRAGVTSCATGGGTGSTPPARFREGGTGLISASGSVPSNAAHSSARNPTSGPSQRPSNATRLQLRAGGSALESAFPPGRFHPPWGARLANLKLRECRRPQRQAHPSPVSVKKTVPRNRESPTPV